MNSTLFIKVTKIDGYCFPKGLQSEWVRQRARD